MKASFITKSFDTTASASGVHSIILTTEDGTETLLQTHCYDELDNFVIWANSQISDDEPLLKVWDIAKCKQWISGKLSKWKKDICEEILARY